MTTATAAVVAIATTTKFELGLHREKKNGATTIKKSFMR